MQLINVSVGVNIGIGTLERPQRKLNFFCCASRGYTGFFNQPTFEDYLHKKLKREKAAYLRPRAKRHR